MNRPHHRLTLSPSGRSRRLPLLVLPLLSLTVLTALLAAPPAAADQPLFPQTPGMVSFTYRHQFAQDIPATLDKIRALGITDMEFSNLFGSTAADIRRELDQRGMQCSSFGVSYQDLVNNTDEVAANAKTLGARFVRVAWIPHQGPFTVEVMRRAIDDFNRAGKRLAEQHDLRFCYHNHGYEFQPHGDGTLFDLLMQQTDPRYVSIELDILWVHHPGADPVAILQQYGERIPLMHLKDLKKGIQGDFTGRTAVENDVALGQGQIDLPAVLAAAQQAGVEHYYIEDESPSIATQVPQSIEYLRSLKQPPAP